MATSFLARCMKAIASAFDWFWTQVVLVVLQVSGV